MCCAGHQLVMHRLTHQTLFTATGAAKEKSDPEKGSTRRLGNVAAELCNLRLRIGTLQLYVNNLE